MMNSVMFHIGLNHVVQPYCHQPTKHWRLYTPSLLLRAATKKFQMEKPTTAGPTSESNPGLVLFKADLMLKDSVRSKFF